MHRTEEISESFLAAVDQWIRTTVDRSSNALNFGTLLCQLPGVYPTVVVQSLHRLIRSIEVDSATMHRLLVESRQLHSDCCVQTHDALPVPHPLDFEWRFTPSTCSRLLEEAVTLATEKDPVVLLGTPSLAAESSSRSDVGRFITLDTNPAMLEYLGRCCPAVRAYRFDAARDIFPNLPPAGVVVADPPWYPEHMKSFLWTASHLCRNYGHVLLCLPPMGTRAGIDTERDDLISWATLNGLECMHVHKGIVTYQTPLFEHNALRTKGIEAPLDWRRADLAIFQRRIGIPTTPRPVVEMSTVTWHEENFGRVRIRLRSPSTQVFDPRLVPLFGGDILPSVSSRHPFRELVDVWTSGNRVFGCRNTFILRSILVALRTGGSPILHASQAADRKLSLSEAEKTMVAYNDCLDVLRIEHDEHAEYTREETCKGIPA